MTGFELAQVNVARFRRPMADPVNKDFVDALDAVNARADAADGFIWRLIGDGGDATDIAVEGEPNMIVNMSVWRDLEALGAFVYRDTEHRAIMRRRKEWFEHIRTYQALWWVPAGHRPTVAEGLDRLATLDDHGPTPDAFLFTKPFPAPGERAVAPVLDRCA